MCLHPTTCILSVSQAPPGLLDLIRFVCFSQFPQETASSLTQMPYCIQCAHSRVGVEAQHVLLPAWWLYL